MSLLPLSPQVWDSQGWAALCPGSWPEPLQRSCLSVKGSVCRAETGEEQQVDRHLSGGQISQAVAPTVRRGAQGTATVVEDSFFWRTRRLWSGVEHELWSSNDVKRNHRQRVSFSASAPHRCNSSREQPALKLRVNSCTHSCKSLVDEWQDNQ